MINLLDDIADIALNVMVILTAVVISLGMVAGLVALFLWLAGWGPVAE